MAAFISFFLGLFGGTACTYLLLVLRHKGIKQRAEELSEEKTKFKEAVTKLALKAKQVEQEFARLEQEKEKFVLEMQQIDIILPKI